MKRALTILMLVLAHLSALSNNWCLSKADHDLSIGRSGSNHKTELPYKMGIVFHLVANNDAVNDITDNDLLNLLMHVNKDLMAQNADLNMVDEDFQNSIAASGILLGIDRGVEFVVRATSDHPPFGNKDISTSEKGGSAPYLPDSYLNIWIADLAEGINGWAWVSNADNNPQGIVLDHSVLNIETKKYRVLTHELGHFLGLQHLEGDTDNCTEDDGIADTPPQDGAVSSCQKQTFMCGEKSMTSNFMNPGDGACLRFFTKGQAAFMQNRFRTHCDKMIQDIDVVDFITDTRMSQPARLMAYPNPFSTQITIKGLNADSDDFSYYVTDLPGRVYTPEVATVKDEIRIGTSWLPVGTYFLKIESPKGTYFFKLIKNE